MTDELFPVSPTDGTFREAFACYREALVSNLPDEPSRRAFQMRLQRLVDECSQGA